MDTRQMFFPSVSLSLNTKPYILLLVKKGHKVAPGIAKRLDVGVCVCVTAVPGVAGEIKITKRIKSRVYKGASARIDV